MQLVSSAFRNGEEIPRRYSCDDENVSPPLSWTGVPPGTHSLVLTCEDPDAPSGTWHHWAIYDIPPDQHGFKEYMPRSDASAGAKQATNDFRKVGYDGPCPPRGDGPHRYRFRLLALSVAHLAFKGRPQCAEVSRKAGEHAIAEAELVGLYRR